MDTPLFQSENFLLTAIDMDNDPEIDAKYTQDLYYARFWCREILRPLSTENIKKAYEILEKRCVEHGDSFHFAIRSKKEQKLIGFFRFSWIGWSNGVAGLRLGIGDPEWRGNCEVELLDVASRYAFDELNLYRIETEVPAYDLIMQKSLITYGFQKEVTNREYYFFENRYWDNNIYGLLYPEWQQIKNISGGHSND